MTSCLRRRSALLFSFLLLLLAAVLAACDGGPNGGGEATATLPPLTLPTLAPAVGDGARLQVVATTSIIGDVVANVGGQEIDLTTLMGPGQDPHSYQPAPADLRRVADADVIFVHGWNLEEGLVADLAQIGENAPLVPVAAGIQPLTVKAHEGDDAGNTVADRQPAADPHTWLDPALVQQWVGNIETALSALDPAHAAVYARNGAAYRTELDALDAEITAQVATIPPQRRLLVTNHDSLAYFAAAYDFTIVGTVRPGASTLAEPSASDLTGLVQAMESAGICTIFVESTSSAALADTVAGELSACDQVAVLSLYTGALGPPGSDAATYLSMMRRNVTTIVDGLAPAATEGG